MDIEPQLQVSDDTWDIADDLIGPGEGFDFSNLDDLDLTGSEPRFAGKDESNHDMLDLAEPSKNLFFKDDTSSNQTEQSHHKPPFANKYEWQNINTELEKDLKVGSFALKVVSREVWWCASVFSIFGIRPEQAAPSMELFSQLIHPMDKEVVYFLMDRAVKQAVPFEITHRIRLLDGTVKWCRFMCRVQYDARTRRVDKLVGTIQDITQWSKSVKSMAQNSDQKSRPKKKQKLFKGASGPTEARGEFRAVKNPGGDDFQIQEDATCTIS